MLFYFTLKYAKLSVDLSKEMKQELVNICNRQGITIKQFIVDAVQEAKNKIERGK